MGLIYMRISPSGGKYIGKTIKTEKERWNDHVYEAYNLKNQDQDSILNKAIRKYGAENFVVEILENNINDEQLLSEREIYWINYYKTFYLDNNHGYNMTRGGDGHARYTENDFIPYWNQGLSVNEISKKLNVRRQTVSDFLHRYGISSEEIAKRAINSQRKTTFTWDLEIAYQLWCQGKNLTEIKKYFNLNENNYTVRDALKDFYGITDEEIKQRGIQTRKAGGHCKPILQFDSQNNFIQEWLSVNDAAKFLDVTKSAISANLNHRTATCKGYIFKYKEIN